MKVPFHVPTRVPEEADLVRACLHGEREDGHFTTLAEQLLEARLGVSYARLTPSCTHALELAAMALELQPGDQVILPAFTFTTTATAFLRSGARLRFADIEPTTLNLDPDSVAALMGPRTRAVAVLHYAGIACDMDAIMGLTKPAGALVVEDAAHALFGAYKGRPLGAVGDMGCFSFHRTKNFSCGEGGAFVTNDEKLGKRAEIIREKGTNRSEFLRGLVHKYEWVGEGSSFVIADLLAAQLAAQLQQADEVQVKRRAVFETYQAGLADWAGREGVARPVVPNTCEPAYHLYYLIMPSLYDRERFLTHLQKAGIGAAFHYLPLHTSPMGRRLGGRDGEAPAAEDLAMRLVRVPMYTDLSPLEQDRVLEVIRGFRCG